MAALTAFRKVNTRKIDFNQSGVEMTYTVAASTTIYQGAFVRIDAGGDIVPCDGQDNAAFPCLGLALQTIDNSGGSDGDLSCKVMVGAYIVATVGSETLADIGKVVYSSDDQTLTLSADNEFVGWIVGMSNEGTSSFVVKMAIPGQTDANHI